MLKFTRTKYSHLSGETRVAYSVDRTEEHPEEFVVEASPRGIEIKGKLFLTTPQVQLHELAKVIGKAGHDHVALRPKITLAHGGSV